MEIKFSEEEEKYIKDIRENKIENFCSLFDKNSFNKKFTISFKVTDPVLADYFIKNLSGKKISESCGIELSMLYFEDVSLNENKKEKLKNMISDLVNEIIEDQYKPTQL